MSKKDQQIAHPFTLPVWLFLPATSARNILTNQAQRKKTWKFNQKQVEIHGMWPFPRALKIIGSCKLWHHPTSCSHELPAAATIIAHFRLMPWKAGRRSQEKVESASWAEQLQLEGEACGAYESVKEWKHDETCTIACEPMSIQDSTY